MATNNAVNSPLSGATGSGAFAGSISAIFTAPLLGTPSTGTLTNCTGLPVAGGGTGRASATEYAVICGGTTSTGAHQSIASVGSANQALTSNGAGALPTMQTAPQGGALTSFQILTSGTGATYTKPGSVVSILVEAIGGAGGGGGCTGATSQFAAAGSGGGGSYCRKWYSASSGTYTYTIGTAGTGGSAGNNNGNPGGDTTFDTMTASGGTGGTGQASSGTGTPKAGAACGVGVMATGGDINFPGRNGLIGSLLTGAVLGSFGGGCYFANDMQGAALTANGGSAGSGGLANSGQGGSGAVSLSNTTSRAGGDGSSGIIIVWEFK